MRGVWRDAKHDTRDARAPGRQSQPLRKDPAFTLVELLVVVGVMGIVAALLLTSSSQAKAKTQQIQCAGNLRQLGIGLQAFVLDNGVYPLYLNPNYNHGAYPAHKSMWAIALQYTELSAPDNSTNRIPFQQWYGNGIWKCPSAMKPADWPEDEGYESYGYNADGTSMRTDVHSLGLGGHYLWNPPRVPAPPVSESELADPAEMMAIADGFVGNDGVIQDGTYVFWRRYGVTNFLNSTRRATVRHQGRANVVFCDGHVESPTLQFLFSNTGEQALARWNRHHLSHREKLSP